MLNCDLFFKMIFTLEQKKQSDFIHESMENANRFYKHPIEINYMIFFTMIQYYSVREENKNYGRFEELFTKLKNLKDMLKNL